MQPFGCDLFYFYIKPQPGEKMEDDNYRCDLFYFYIKPQPSTIPYENVVVVTYSISTSNHNLRL